MDRLKAELVVFKSLMSDVSISMKSCHQQFPRLVSSLHNRRAQTITEKECKIVFTNILVIKGQNYKSNPTLPS